MKLNTIKGVITGGVSGLGFAVAEKFVAEGGSVTLLDVNEARAADAMAALGDAPAESRTCTIQLAGSRLSG